MNWVTILIIYCIVCILAFIYIRRRCLRIKKTDFIFWLIFIPILPFYIISLPIWLPFVLIRERKKNKQLRIWKDEHKRWMKEYKARTIIGGAERVESGLETLSTYKCDKCGYTLRSAPQGFFKLSSDVYYNFKCEKCSNIVSVCSKDISYMSYVQCCPLCEEYHCFSFWNPVEGCCPKCNGKMKEQISTSKNI